MIIIIAEKPAAAERIAKALGEPKKVEEGGAYYFQVGDKVVIPAVGHLFGLKQATRGSYYPVFEVEWAPTFEINKKNEYARKYLENLKKFVGVAEDVYIATDYDVEGSVIGYNILRFVFNREKAKRMKFSTLTKEELLHAFQNPTELNMGMIKAGLTRHTLDWYYGINLSRALTHSIKKVGKVFSVLSIGRVQGPMLYFLVKREREIRAFKPKPFWQVTLKFRLRGKEFEALYREKQIWEEEKAYEVVKSCEGKKGIIKDVKKRVVRKNPPAPFDLTSLQTEAYNLFGYSPKRTLDIAQSLYTQAYISYPRTSSQKLPRQLDLRGILKKLSAQKEFRELCQEILKGKVEPHEGKKKDPAHPAIHPTGEVPKKLTGPERKIYELIVRRFLSCFMEPAERESISLTVDVNGNEFLTSGSRTLKEGWMKAYKPFLKLQEVEFPDVKVGEEVEVRKLEKLEKETQPPQRYTQGSIIKEMEKRNLGTKATRAQILQTLYDRGYIVNKSIQVTDLGMTLVEALERYCPTILSEELTREFERKMEEVMEGRIPMEKVLEEARTVLKEILKEFKENEEKIGGILDDALMRTREEERTLGRCPKCGGNLKVIYTKRGRFVGCSNYPKCKNMYPIPKVGTIKKTGKTCEKCGTPIIYVFRKGKRPFKMCLDPNCETKSGWGKKR